MKTLENLGHHERIIRIGIGMAFLAFSGLSVLPGWGDLLLMGIGLIALLTGIIGYCPGWHAMGIDTTKNNHDHSPTNTHS